MSSNKVVDIEGGYSYSENAVLGTGSFGEVFKGYSKIHGKQIAVKHVKVTQGYERQIETLKALSSLTHPNIMGYYGFTSVDKDAYMFMELCSGGCLTSLLKKGITQIQALKLFRQLIEGMCYMNSKGNQQLTLEKMHRDLKPDNILIGPQMDIKISDFGLARETKNSIFITGKQGTPIYAGPQVYITEEYTENCDVWSAGLILYELVTGQMLFCKVKTYTQLKNEWQNYRTGGKRVIYDKKYNPLWEYFTNKMLIYDSTKRPKFHQILEILKKLWNYMEKQIMTKNNERLQDLNPRAKKIHNYLTYEVQKYEVLLIAVTKMTQTDINIRNSVKYIVMFLCVAQYLCHMKRNLRNLRNQTICIQNTQESIENQTKQFEIVYLFDKFRSLIETNYNFWQQKIKLSITKKLLLDYCKRQQDHKVFDQYRDIHELIKNVDDGFYDVEQTYEKNLQVILLGRWAKIKRQQLEKMNKKQLQLYHLLLVAGQIQTVFPEKIFNCENIVRDQIRKFNQYDEQKLISSIQNKLKSLENSLDQ